jgi:hypothetical protein
MCATEDGRVFVLSSAARLSFFEHPAEVHVFDPTGRPLQCIVLADEDERFDQIAVTSDGRILVFGGFRDISFLNEDGTLTRSPWSGAHDLRDMLWAGDSLYVLTDGLLSGSTEEGVVTCHRQLHRSGDTSNLAANREGGCTVCVDGTLLTVGSGPEAKLRLATVDLWEPRLWLSDSGPVFAAAKSAWPPGPVWLRACGNGGLLRAERRLWVSSACLDQMQLGRSVATARVGDRLLALNLEPLKVREFDADLNEGPGFYVCGSRWEALLLRLHNTLEAAFGPGGMLLLAARVFIGLSDLTMVGLLLFAGVLLYGEFRLLRRLFRDEFGLTPPWVWGVVLLFPWAGTYALVWKWSQMLMVPAEPEERTEAAEIS